jgi:hypothetical protein
VTERDNKGNNAISSIRDGETQIETPKKERLSYLSQSIGSYEAARNPKEIPEMR